MKKFIVAMFVSLAMAVTAFAAPAPVVIKATAQTEAKKAAEPVVKAIQKPASSAKKVKKAKSVKAEKK